MNGRDSTGCFHIVRRILVNIIGSRWIYVCIYALLSKEDVYAECTQVGYNREEGVSGSVPRRVNVFLYQR